MGREMTGSDNRRTDAPTHRRTDAPTHAEREGFDVWLRMAARAGRVVVGAVFAIAALQKASQPEEALRALSYGLGLFPHTPNIASGLLVLLVAIELLIAAALLFDIWSQSATVFALILLVLFTGWILFLLLTDAGISCGCGTGRRWASAESAGWFSVGRNAVLSACVFPTFLSNRINSVRSARSDLISPLLF